MDKIAQIVVFFTQLLMVNVIEELGSLSAWPTDSEDPDAWPITYVFRSGFVEALEPGDDRTEGFELFTLNNYDELAALYRTEEPTIADISKVAELVSAAVGKLLLS